MRKLDIDKKFTNGENSIIEYGCDSFGNNYAVLNIWAKNKQTEAIARRTYKCKFQIKYGEYDYNDAYEIELIITELIDSVLNPLL